MHKITPRDNPCYCINFRRAANTLTKFYDREFASINLTTSQFSLLSDIHMLKSCNKSELAQYTRLDRTTIIRNLNVLREKGLMKDVPDGGNRNAGIRLTEAGETAIREGTAIWKKSQSQVKSIIGAENTLILKHLFADIDALNDIV